MERYEINKMYKLASVSLYKQLENCENDFELAAISSALHLSVAMQEASQQILYEHRVGVRK